MPDSTEETSRDSGQSHGADSSLCDRDLRRLGRCVAAILGVSGDRYQERVLRAVIAEYPTADHEREARAARSYRSRHPSTPPSWASVYANWLTLRATDRSA